MQPQGTEHNITLGHVAEIVMGQSPPGSTVSHHGELPLLNGPTEFGTHHPTPAQYTVDPRKKAREGDILFCVRGSTTGRMNWADQDYAIGRGIAAIRHRQDLVLQPFVRAVIESQLPDLLAQATGSTFPNVSARQLNDIPYPRLSTGEQRRIAHILGTLDDKIELNRRMNATLESMVQALFKSWFVDFEPVRAKTDGRWRRGESLPGMPADLYDLFPEGLVASDLGEIPAGWEARKIGDAFNLTMGQSPPGNTYNDDDEGLSFFQGSTDFGFRYPTERRYCTAPKRIANSDDTLVSVRAPVGAINMAWEQCCIGRGLAALRHKSGSASYTYYAVMSIQGELQQYEHTGTVFGAINKGQFSDLGIIEPSAKVIEMFASFVSEWDGRIRLNNANSINLAVLRDALLPRLISGTLEEELQRHKSFGSSR